MTQENIHQKIKKHCVPKEYIYKPILDGIINNKGFDSAKFKILWILKEAYDYDVKLGKQGFGGWDLTEQINKNEKFWKSKTLSTIGFISWCLLNGCTNYKNCEIDTNGVGKVLKQIAIINVNKMPALYNTRSDNLYLERIIYPHYSKILQDQIKYIEPQILIFGYTFYNQFKDDLGLKCILENKESDISWYIKENQKIYISTYHPAARINKEDYANSIINIVKEKFNELQK